MKITDIFHMFALLSKKGGSGKVMEEDKFRAMLEDVKAMNLPDVVIN